MRLLFLPVLALALASVLRAQPASTAPTPDEQKAIDAAAKAGGKADIDPKLPAPARVSVKFENATDGMLLSLKKMSAVGAVDAYDATRCTDKGFAVFKDVPNLRRLILSKSEMTPPRVTAIGQCKELRDLRLPGSGLSDAELASLKKLARLESLDVSENPRVTDKGLATVKTFDRLQALYLARTSVSDKGLAELKGLEGLRTLYLGGTRVTADAADKFAEDMPNLRVVRK